jgi:pyruvate ferredoxin oxidoreductase alpha subunit
MVFGKVLAFCPLNWRTEDDAAEEVLQAAVDSCFFPIYEVEQGHTVITYDPDANGRRRPVADWLGLMGKTKHLLSPDNAEYLEAAEAEVERRWQRLKTMHAQEGL